MSEATKPVPRKRAVVTITAATEFIRLPRSGERCQVSGLSRSALIDLVVPNLANGGKPPVKSKLLKSRPTNISGVRLILVASLLHYLKGDEGEENWEDGRVALGSKPPGPFTH